MDPTLGTPGTGLNCEAWIQFEVELDLAAAARSWTEIQVSQQGPGRGVLAQRRRYDSREAVGACPLQRSEGERCPDALAAEVVRDLDRDVGNAGLIGRLDVPCGGHE